MGMWCNGSIRALEAWGVVQIQHFQFNKYKKGDKYMKRKQKIKEIHKIIQGV